MHGLQDRLNTSKEGVLGGVFLPQRVHVWHKGGISTAACTEGICNKESIVGMRVNLGGSE